MDIDIMKARFKKMEEARLLIEALEDVEEGRMLDGKSLHKIEGEGYGIWGLNWPQSKWI